MVGNDLLDPQPNFGLGVMAPQEERRPPMKKESSGFRRMMDRLGPEAAEHLRLDTIAKQKQAMLLVGPEEAVSSVLKAAVNELQIIITDEELSEFASSDLRGVIAKLREIILRLAT